MSKKAQVITESQHILSIKSGGMAHDTHIYLDGSELKNVSKAVIYIKAGDPVYGKIWMVLPELDFKEEVYEFRKAKSKKYREEKI